MLDFIELFLTCEDQAEATKVAKALLSKHLIACAKQLPVSADYWWEGEVEHANEVLLVMESRTDLFEQVEAEVATLHSYETFVLEAVPLTRISKRAHVWAEENIHG